MSSSPEAYDLAAQALGSMVEIEFVAKAIREISGAPSVHQSPHLVDHISRASSNVLDSNPTDEHSAISWWFDDGMLNPDEENFMTDQDDMRKIKELQVYIDTVKKTVKPGCSKELLDVALSSVSNLVEALSLMSSNQKLQSSL